MSRANWFMPATKSRRNRRVVERQGAVDQFGDQTRLLREELMAHFSPASDIGFECRLSLDDDPDRGRRLGRAVDQPVGRCQSGHRLVEAGLGPVAAAHVEDDGADAPAHRDLGAQAVRPKPLDPTVFELFGSGYAKIDEPRPRRSRHRGDRHAVARQIDPGFYQQPAQPLSTQGAVPMLRPLTTPDIAARARHLSGFA